MVFSLNVCISTTMPYTKIINKIKCRQYFALQSITNLSFNTFYWCFLILTLTTTNNNTK